MILNLLVGIPFGVVDRKPFKDLVGILNPAYAINMPSSRRVSGALLDENFTNMTQEITMVIKKSPLGGKTLSSDGLTNIRKNHVVNFNHKMHDNDPILWKIINTSGVRQDARGVADGAIEAINEIGPEHVDHYVTDNCNVMLASWSLIKAEFPKMECYGCAAHVVNLLVKDIHTKDAEFKKVCGEADSIVSFVNNHHFTHNLFIELQAEFGCKLLAHNVPTRWFSISNTLNTVKDAEQLIKQMVSTHRQAIKSILPATTSANFIKLVENNRFWVGLKNSTEKIKIPAQVIGRLEANDATVEIVMSCFIELHEHFRNDNVIKAKVMDRWQFIGQDVHRAAHLLNHKQAMDIKYMPKEAANCYDAFTRIAQKFKGEAFADRAETELYKFHQQMRELDEGQKNLLRRTSSLHYWDLIGKSDFPSLAALAKQIFGAASSAFSERTWSAYKNIHSRLRNSLSDSKVNKILCLRTNQLIKDKSLSIEELENILQDELSDIE